MAGQNGILSNKIKPIESKGRSIWRIVFIAEGSKDIKGLDCPHSAWHNLLSALQKSANRSLSISFSSLSNFGLSNRGDKDLKKKHTNLKLTHKKPACPLS